MKKQLSCPLLPREINWGIPYLIFSLAILGSLIKLVLGWVWPDCPPAWSDTVIDTIYYAINLTAAVFIFRHFLKESIFHAVEQMPRILLVCGIALVVYFLVVPALEMLIEYLSEYIERAWGSNQTHRPDYDNLNNVHIIKKAATTPGLTAFGIVLLVPAAEEILYRGLLFGGLRNKHRVLAYLVSILVFSAIHVVPYIGEYTMVEFALTLVVYLPAGLILAMSYEYSDSIFAPIFIHTIINALSIIVR